MNTWNQTLFITAICLALAAWGCGDDSRPTDTGTGGDTGTVDTGTGGDGSTDTGTGGDASDGSMCRSPGDYYMGSDNCTSAEDMAAAAREDYGTDMDQSLADIAGSCGVGCISDPDLVACTTACVVTGSGDEVSAMCASCYAASVACSAENCIGPCLADPGGEPCAMCRGGMNDCSFDCTMEFYDCSGLPVP